MLQLFKNIQVMCSLLLFVLEPTLQSCPGIMGTGCAVNSRFCYCYTAKGNMQIGCSGYSNNEFPSFSYFTSTPISLVTTYGEFTNVYDNSYYLLTTMSNATVCLENYASKPTNLTTYETTFETTNPTGISSLMFFYYNPQNLTTMSNKQGITSLTIQNANLLMVPDVVPQFTNLNTLDLSKNQISQINIASSSLSYIEFSYNQIVNLDTNSFQLSSLVRISIIIKNNWLTELKYASFHISSKSVTIDVSNNKITSVDPQFATWLQSSANCILNLSGNELPCDSTVQWMANFVICAPAKILLTRTEKCLSGETLYNYLKQYATCNAS